MKNFLNFILSFILPRRMVKHMNMKFLLALVLILVASVFNILSSSMRAKKDATKALEFPTLFTDVDGITFDNEIPNVSLDNSESSGYVYIDGVKTEQKGSGLHLNADKNGVYTGTAIKNDKTIVVTVVLADETFSAAGSMSNPAIVEGFDLDGYCNQTVNDKTEYVLYVFTLDNVYYLFGLSQTEDEKSTVAASNYFVYETDSEKNLIYYLPKDDSELAVNGYGKIDTTLWTRTASKTDTIDFTIPDEYKAYEEQIVPTKRHLKNIYNALYGNVISYPNLDACGLEIKTLNSDFPEFQNQFKTSLVSVRASQINLSSLIVSAFITIIIPFILTLITWLLSKSFYMKKYRQYYAIAAITFFDTSLVSIIVGIFVSYLSACFWILLGGTLYFITACFRINTIPETHDEAKPEDEAPKEEPKVKYRPMEDVTRVG